MLSIASFLADFERVASRRIPRELLESRQREIRNHLESSAKEVGEIEAVRRFGSPRQLANELVRMHRGYATANPGRLIWTVGCLIGLSILFYDYRFEIIQAINGKDLRLLFLPVWLPVLALFAFGIRAAQTRRWLVSASIPYLLATSIAAFALSPFVARLRPVSNRDFAAATRYLAEIRNQRDTLAQWQRGNPPTDRAPVETMAQPILDAPMVPFRVELGSPFSTYGLAKSDSATAAESWRRYGHAWAVGYPDRLQEVERNYLTTQADWEGRIAFPVITGQLVSANALSLTIQILLLTLTNILALIIAKAADHRFTTVPRTGRKTGSIRR